MACSLSLPNVQLLAQLAGGPPTFQAFNVPLFDSGDCSYQVPAKAVETDGNIPSGIEAAQANDVKAALFPRWHSELDLAQRTL